jgi:hypothetical protein
MTQAIEGIYRNGIIELSAVPDDIQESRVLVTFLPPKPKSPKMITLGMFKGDRQSTEEDFAIAEFHDDALIANSSSGLGFWDNEIDDAEWNNA